VSYGPHTPAERMKALQVPGLPGLLFYLGDTSCTRSIEELYGDPGPVTGPAPLKTASAADPYEE
jgi:hypothetical protein